jgi:hypothetical protein
MDIAFTITVSVLIAIVVGVTQSAKAIGLPTRYAPLVSLAVAILATIGLSLFEATTTVILTGIMVGLSACGLYDLGTKTFEK